MDPQAPIDRDLVAPFIDGLSSALFALETVLAGTFDLSRPAGFVDRLRRSLACVRYLYTWPERFTLESPFTLDPTRTGFPSFKDLLAAEEDRAGAAARLNDIPD